MRWDFGVVESPQIIYTQDPGKFVAVLDIRRRNASETGCLHYCQPRLLKAILDFDGEYNSCSARRRISCSAHTRAVGCVVFHIVLVEREGPSTAAREETIWPKKGV